MRDDYSTSSGSEDDNLAVDLSNSSASNQNESEPEGARDEVKAIERLSQKETTVIRTWRIILLALLLLAAVSVTTVTYLLLKNEDEKAYAALVSIFFSSRTFLSQLLASTVSDKYGLQFAKFSGTIGDAAVRQQENVRAGYKTMSDAVTAASQTEHAEWPFFRMPLFESHAANAMKQMGAETMILCNIVPSSLQESYLAWMDDKYYDIIAEANMIRHGNLDGMPSNSTYQSGFLKASPNGFIPDDERDIYYPVTAWSPPPNSFA